PRPGRRCRRQASSGSSPATSRPDRAGPACVERAAISLSHDAGPEDGQTARDRDLVHAARPLLLSRFRAPAARALGAGSAGGAAAGWRRGAWGAPAGVGGGGAAGGGAGPEDRGGGARGGRKRGGAPGGGAG